MWPVPDPDPDPGPDPDPDPGPDPDPDPDADSDLDSQSLPYLLDGLRCTTIPKVAEYSAAHLLSKMWCVASTASAKSSMSCCRKRGTCKISNSFLQQQGAQRRRGFSSV